VCEFVTDAGRGGTLNPGGEPPDRMDDEGDAGALSSLRSVANYQFGAGAGRALFPPGESHTVRTSASGRPRQVLADGDGGRVVSYGTDGLLTLGVVGGRRLVAAGVAPRVAVGDESEPYVREGRNAFAKFVRSVDDGVRPGDEAVVTVDGDVVAVGRAVLWPAAMRAFETGVAVEVRHGAGDG